MIFASPPPKESLFLESLEKSSAKYFSNKFSKTSCLSSTYWFTFPNGSKFYFLVKLYWDEELGIFHRVLVSQDLGKNEFDIELLAQFRFEKKPIRNMALYGPKQGTEAFSAKIYIYTNKLHEDIKKFTSEFHRFQPESFIEIIEEDKLFKTTFISYGGPDEDIASKINKCLKSNGIKTWFFPDDAIPGEKLHRVMSKGIDKFDKTLLICSENSIERYGVLNEIERMLEKEASLGGREIIIPITLDDYIFDKWNPERADIKKQLLSRVICKLDSHNINIVIQKILPALKSN